MRKGIAILLSVALAACGGVSISSENFAQLTPAAQVEVIKTDFNTNLDLLISYRSQPECSETVIVGCYDAGTYDKLATAAIHADTAIDKAEALVTSGVDFDAATVAAARSLTITFINALAAEELAS